MKRKVGTILIACLLLIASSACGSPAPKPSPTATPPVDMGDASFADGRGLQVGFKLLYALESLGGNSILGTSTLSQALATVKYAAAGDTAEALARELGMQDMQPRQVNEVALRMRQTFDKLKQGRYTTAWCMIYGEKQYIRESYYTDCRQMLQLKMLQYQPKDNENGLKFLGEWVDDNTGGRIKQVQFKLPEVPAPYIMDILTADPDWALALDTGKSRPLPFTYENGEKIAVPTMICKQKCGIFESELGSVAILPTAEDETRFVIMVPPAGMPLREFIPDAAAKHDEWLAAAEWGDQRVLLPRVKLDYSGSVMPVLDKAGLSKHLSSDADYSTMGEGLYFSDILHMASLILDESGVGDPDPKVTYRQGIKDNIRTLAVDRPFLVLLEKTEPDYGSGQVLMMGFVRDPLEVPTK